MKTWKLTLLLATIFLAALLAGGYAIYLMESNHIVGTPTSQATLTITPSTTDPVAGVSWTITAHVSDNAADISVILFNGASQVDVQTTDATGNAVFTVAPTAPFDYYATANHP